MHTSSAGACPRLVRTPCALALCAHDVPCLQVPAQRSSARPCCALGVPVQFVVDLPRLAQTTLADIVYTPCPMPARAAMRVPAPFVPA